MNFSVLLPRAGPRLPRGEAPMTLRIDVVAAEGPPTIVLSGRLSRAEVAEFERTVAETGLPLRIDLGQLVQADAEGRQSLCRQKRRGRFSSVPRPTSGCCSTAPTEPSASTRSESTVARRKSHAKDDKNADDSKDFRIGGCGPGARPRGGDAFAGAGPAAEAGGGEAVGRAEQQTLRSYTWIEKVELSLKGEVKNTTVNSCRYGPDGKVQKTTVVAPPPAEKKRGLRAG